ncbi:MAG: hypothetical protein N2561_05645 [Bacteroidetes bacterium]|nr:hypothetical protein [Rhodothermia bacterium]MCS7154836.1 hypothetical protein [Bacteroidota bacterium]MCX7907006.1 hypothetical protein [Bacteroidota bacterium]MDW8137630.1 hypothetical protein [Bacteroidota bacterium]MDW8285416.1 hypothetical protein [Bacteroidota bacterium]
MDSRNRISLYDTNPYLQHRAYLRQALLEAWFVTMYIEEQTVPRVQVEALVETFLEARAAEGRFTSAPTPATCS